MSESTFQDKAKMMAQAQVYYLGFIPDMNFTVVLFVAYNIKFFVVKMHFFIV